GVSAAEALTRFGRTVTLVEAEGVGAGATGVAAGLVNPFMGPKATPVWRHEWALDALGGLLDAADATLRYGLVRPARDARQAEAFQARAAEHPEALTWLRAEEVTERWPALRAPLGALDVHAGAVWADPAADLARLVQRLADEGRIRHVRARLTAWGEDADGAWAEVAHAGGPERLSADRVLLALGGGLAAFPVFQAMGLHAVKGEVHEAACDGDLPAVAAGAYAVPAAPGRVHLGGTYDHAFTHVRPTDEARADLLSRLVPFLPNLRPLEGAAAWAGVRVNAPNRLPRVSPLPGHRRVWAFTALGSKGLLLAPLIAAYLPQWLPAPETIPEDFQLMDRT
ncbi:MAG TPA: FAD-binding oxidoreductase, partial [Rhodothermales bacterium]|nr:FAD-binding oxidoreductase [Rhodothermales bacterium]